jgi:hypothetical protein
VGRLSRPGDYNADPAGRDDRACHASRASAGGHPPEVIARQQGDPLSGGCYDDVAQNTLVIAGGKSP